MGTLIDSSVLIAAERDRFDLETALGARSDEAFAIAAITASELLHGVHRARTQIQRQRREVYVEKLLAALPVLAFDLVVARVHASLGARLAGRGGTIGAHDLLIAATAIAAGYKVATHDVRSFARIPGVELERW